MLHKDYIMRLVREFAEALELLLKKDVRQRRDEIEKMYEMYVGPYAFYHTSPLDDVMDSFTRFPEEERLRRMEMLAELYYAEAPLLGAPMREAQLNNALALFGFIDRHDRTYSLDRMAKMADIRRRIAEAQSGAAGCTSNAPEQ